MTESKNLPVHTRGNTSGNTNSNRKKNKRINPTIKHDGVNPSDYLKYDLRSSCEECSHFDSIKIQCTFGYVVEPHLKINQQKSYTLSGKIAFCRFHEID
ncbi:MAG TPA: hypothetical protein PLU50_00465 [Pseudobdellovibrionaceae bacterium]|nr:hypothetical protein [Pseudobdellovibrionaceae bacterium]